MPNLRVPGPTPCPDQVLEAVGRQMINHRGPEFAQLLSSLTTDLQKVFQTKNDILILTCSGTGGMEAAVANLLSPGERTMVISIGVFGDRFAQLAQAYGAEVVRLGFPLGSAADPEKVREALRTTPSVQTVFLTHNETSTGTTNDLDTLGRIIKVEFDKTLVVDGISSIASIPCPVDKWSIDVAISGSQKGWMTPPGLVMLSVSPRAWKAIAKARMPRAYLDLTVAKQSLENGETPWTPALSVFYGLRAGLDLLFQEGMEQVYQRHARLGARTRQAVQRLGLELFASERYASNTVTAVKMPEGIRWKALSELLRREYEVVLAGGQTSLAGKIFRIGHMGWVSEAEIDQAIASVGEALTRLRSGRPMSARDL